MVGYQNEIATRMGTVGVDVVNVGMVDCPEKAFDAADAMRKEGVEIVFLLMAEGESIPGAVIEKIVVLMGIPMIRIC